MGRRAGLPPSLGKGIKRGLATYSENDVFLHQRMLGRAVTEDRLLPSTFMHLETAVASAQLFALEAEQPGLPRSLPKAGPPALWLCPPLSCPGHSPSSLPELAPGSGWRVPAGASPCEGETGGFNGSGQEPCREHAWSRAQFYKTGTAWALAPCQSRQCSRSPVLGQVCTGTRGTRWSLAPCVCPCVGRGARTALPTAPRLC